jgi:hypothetical protein
LVSWGFSKEFTSTSVPSPGPNGPLTTAFFYANNNNAEGAVVALMGDAVARTNSDEVFGANLLVRNAAGNTNTKMIGLEIDVQPSAGTTVTTSSCGLVLNVFNIASSASVGLIGGLGGSWANGMVSSHIRGAHYSVNIGDPVTSLSFVDASQGSYSQAAIVLGTGAAQALSLGSAAYNTSPRIWGDSGGGLRFNMGANGIVAITLSDTALFTFDSSKAMNFPTGGSIRINNLQVLTQRNTGWAPMTGSPNKATVYDTATVTLAQLAGRVMELQSVLTGHGLIGA